MQKYGYIFIFIFCHDALTALAQPPDFIIDWHGDTIYGLISKQPARNYQRIVEFTKPVECETYVLDQLKFYPQDIIAYYKHQVGFFVSKTIKAEHASYFPEWQVGTAIFLKVLVQGYFNLLEYQSVDGKTYFFFDTPEQRSDMIALTEKNYKTILDRYLRYCHHKACNATQYRLQREKLIELFKRHNRYRMGEPGEYLCTPDIPLFVEYGVRSGLQYTHQAQWKSKHLAQPYAGLFLHITQRKRWAFQPEINWLAQSFQRQSPTSSTSVAVRYHYLQFAPAVMYEILPISHVKPYVLVGAAANLIGSRSQVVYAGNTLQQPFSEQMLIAGTGGTIWAFRRITILYEGRFFYARHFSKLLEMSQYGVQIGTSARF